MQEHVCDLGIDFDGDMICYTCFKMDWNATEKFWNDYKTGALTR